MTKEINYILHSISAFVFCYTIMHLLIHIFHIISQLLSANAFMIIHIQTNIVLIRMYVEVFFFFKVLLCLLYCMMFSMTSIHKATLLKLNYLCFILFMQLHSNELACPAWVSLDNIGTTTDMESRSNSSEVESSYDYPYSL